MHKGTLIVDVEPGSTPWEIGIRGGDWILSVNGEPAVDSLAAVYLLSNDEPVSIEFHTARYGRVMFAADEPDEFLATLEFESLAIKQCSNDCIYCFCKQNPPHARTSFRQRDEDFRMSFLAGYYSTLSAITQEELIRIAEHHLSPQYITVPSTDERVRGLMLGREGRRPILDALRFLITNDITIHAQIVICPGFNDGADLERTVSDLAMLGGQISSVALIPVGLTRYTEDSRLRRHTDDELRDLIRLVYRWRYRRSASGGRWLEAADEAYIALRRGIPASKHYGTYPQVASGVGMARLFLDDIRSVARRRRPSWWSHADILLISGMLFSPVLRKWIDRLNTSWGHGIRLATASNDFFGPQVTVAGLLSARDIMSVLRNRKIPDVLVLPDDILDVSGQRFVDDMTVNQLKEQTGIPEIVFASIVGDAFSVISQRIE